MAATNALFWARAFPLVLQYGYSDNNQNDKGGIPSGPSGEGIFPVVLILEIAVMLIYIDLMVSEFPSDPPTCIRTLIRILQCPRGDTMFIL